MDNQYNSYNFELEFKNYLLSNGHGSVTVKNYLVDFRHFWGWLELKLKSKFSNFVIDRLSPSLISSIITVEALQQYKHYLFSNKIPQKTINRRLSSLRKFCSFCVSQNWLKENPAKKIANIQPDKKPEHILIEFKNSLLQERMSNLTIKNYLADIKEFLEIISSTTI